MGQEQNSEYYNAIYRHHRVHYKSHFSRCRLFPVWSIILGSIAHFDLPPRSRVLDLGCGAGQFAEFFTLIHPNLLYFGIDFSTTALQFARQKYQSPNFIQADLNQIPVFLPRFQCFILSEILEHIQNDIALISAIPSSKPILASVPSFEDRAHVRIFSSFKDIQLRYPMLEFIDFSVVNNYLLFVAFKKTQQTPFSEKVIRVGLERN